MKSEDFDPDRDHRRTIRRIWITIILIIVIFGGGIGYFLLNKVQQQSTVEYKGIYNPDKTTFYLIQVPDTLVPQIKQAFVKKLCRLENFIDHAIWITLLPDSFAAGDPIDKRVKYHTALNILNALDSVNKIIVGGNLKNTELFYSFSLDSVTRKRLVKMDINTAYVPLLK